MQVVTNRDTGRSKGYGFVTFDSEDSRRRAIEDVSGDLLPSVCSSLASLMQPFCLMRSGQLTARTHLDVIV